MKKTLKTLSIALCAIMALSACKKESVNSKDHDLKVATYTGIELGSQNNPKGCFLSLTNGLIFTTAAAYDNQTDVDIVFWYNRDTGGANSTAAWFTTPASTMTYHSSFHQEGFVYNTHGINNWQTLNSAEIGLLRITSGEFDEIQTVGQLISAYNSNIGVTSDAHNPKVNDILRFKTNRGKYATMRIKSITGNATSTTGMIVVDVKAQP